VACPAPRLKATLFPYTTLFRSHAEKRQHWKLPGLADELRRLREIFHVGTVVGDSGGGASKQVVESFASMFGLPMLGAQKGGMGRSEEHTSELQSRENLVCRLLL